MNKQTTEIKVKVIYLNYYDLFMKLEFVVGTEEEEF